jgi:anaerobic selenocysteine-containing dehydrogenase
VTDAIFLVGHNMASTQTVLWARVLDRLEGPRPPKLVVVDPRPTVAARRADVHLAPRPGTNLALLNGLLRIIIQKGWIDSDFIRDHTVDFETLVTHTDPWTPEATERVTGVRAAQLERRRRSSAPRRRSCRPASRASTSRSRRPASAVQVNNLHIIRGLIGKPGSTVFQMNGQPTGPEHPRVRA